MSKFRGSAICNVSHNLFYCCAVLAKAFFAGWLGCSERWKPTSLLHQVFQSRFGLRNTYCRDSQVYNWDIRVYFLLELQSITMWEISKLLTYSHLLFQGVTLVNIKWIKLKIHPTIISPHSLCRGVYDSETKRFEISIRCILLLINIVLIFTQSLYFPKWFSSCFKMLNI